MPTTPCIRYRHPSIESLISKVNVLRLVERPTVEDLHLLRNALSDLQALHEQFERYDLAVETEPGTEKRLNLGQAFEESKIFYETHNLSTLRQALPSFKRIRFAPEQIERIKESMKEGFDRVIFFPPAKTLSWHCDEILLGTTKVSGIPGDYGQPAFRSAIWQDPALRVSKNRPDKTAYLLMYKSGPSERYFREKEVVPDGESLVNPYDLYTKNAADLEEKFDKMGWNSFTLEEFLILQKKEFDQTKNHDFERVEFIRGRETVHQFLLDSQKIEGDEKKYGLWRLSFVNNMYFRDLVVSEAYFSGQFETPVAKRSIVIPFDS